MAQQTAQTAQVTTKLLVYALVELSRRRSAEVRLRGELYVDS